MNQKIISLKALPLFVVAGLLLSFSACRQKSQTEGSQVKMKRASDMVVDTIPADTTAATDSSFFTYAMASEVIQPGYKCDEKFIASLFGDLGLSMQMAEQYISDADWGGDNPAVDYCWGENVQYENYKLQSTADKYFGTQFNFLFDESRRTGVIRRFAIITSSQSWYQQFMEAAVSDGLKLVGKVDSAINGKKGKMYQKNAGQVEDSTEPAYYYVYDYSIDGKYEVEIGFDNGIDM